MILDQPWQIELYHLNVLKHRLRIEISTGMTRSGGRSVLRATNETLMRNGVIDRPLPTKAQALVALTDYIDEKERKAGLHG